VNNDLDSVSRSRACDPVLVKLAIDSLAVSLSIGLEYLINYTYLSDENAVRVLEAGFLSNICELYNTATDLDKAKILQVLSNLAVNPPESTAAFMKCPLIEKMGEILREGEIRVKKESLSLILRCLVKSGVHDGIEFCKRLGLVPVIVEMLFSDDEGILYDSMICLTYLVTKCKIVESDLMAGMLADEVSDRLNELVLNAPGSLSQNAENLLRVIE
jgi:hypothetical protein